MTFHKILPGLAGLLLAAAPLCAAAPPVGPNVRVNAPQEGQYGRSGNALAASADGQRLVAAWDDVQGTCSAPFNRPCKPQDPPGLSGVGVSADGGRTWTDLGGPPPTAGAVAGGHTWADRGGTGDSEMFYVVSRARKVDSTDQFIGQQGLLLHRGRFENGRFVWKDSRGFGPAKSGDFWRGPNVAAAKDGSGRVYIAYTNLRDICGRDSSSGGTIELLRSEDGGATWADPVVVAPDTTFETVDPKDPFCGSHGYFQFTPTISLGPDGEIYVTWQLGLEFQIDWRAVTQKSPPYLGFGFSRSLDGGRTFTLPRYVTFVNSLDENPPAGFNKDVMNDTPRMAVAARGPHRGRIYFVYANVVEETSCKDDIFLSKSYSPLSSQVYLLWSDNRGQNWEGPFPLGPPVPRTGLKRFFPTVSVLADGTVDVVYFESREIQRTADPNDVECPLPLASGLIRRGLARSMVDLWWVRSTDGGTTLGKPVRVTSETSDWCATTFDAVGTLFPNYGDYLGIAQGPDRTLLLWTDGRTGIPEAFFTTLGGAR